MPNDTGLSCRVVGRFACAILVSFLGLILPLATYAQGAEADPLAVAFSRMMSHLNDPDAALDYARVAAAAGQPRAAIAALERVLRANPNLDNIRLELASLYMSVGSPAMASIYAKEALGSPNIPPDVAVRASDLLAQAEKGSSRSLLQLNLFAGIRHDSDATQATSLGSVPVFSPIFGPVQVAPGVRAQPDGSSVLSGQINHHYDLNLQQEGSWETNFSFFDQRFFHISHNYDLALVQADTGPRLGIGRIGAAEASIRPFGSVAWIGYGDVTYATLYGGGVSGELRTPVWQTQFTALGRFGNYQNSSFRPQTRPYTGPEWTLTASASYFPDPTMSINFGAIWYQATGQEPDFSREGPGINLSIAKSVAVADRSVDLVARGNLQRLRYGGPNPQIDPFSSRVDTYWEVGLSATVPIIGSVAAVAQYSYIRNVSSYQIYQFDDHAFTLGLRLVL